MHEAEALQIAEAYARSHLLPWGAEVLAIQRDNGDWDVVVESLEPVVTPKRNCDCGTCGFCQWPTRLELRVEPSGCCYVTEERPPFVAAEIDSPCKDPRSWVTRCCREQASPGVLAAVEQIEEAFHGVSRGEVTLHQADVLDGYGGDAEMAAAAATDREACWEQVPAGDIEHAPVLFCFLDEVSRHYYLPAVMIWRLLHPRGSGWSGTDVEYELERATTLRRSTPQQAAAARAFLHTIRMLNNEIDDHWDASRALAAGWDEAGREASEIPPAIE